MNLAGWMVALLVVIGLIGSTGCGSKSAKPHTAAAISTAAPATTEGQSPSQSAPSSPSRASVTVAPADTQQHTSSLAATALASLAVKGRAPKTGYSRAQFGQAWSDDTANPLGHNGCDTRNDILRRDLTSVALKAGTNGCVVLTGMLTDPYSAKLIHFIRGSGTSTAVEIDHVVALSDAWQTGAQQLSADERRDLANDPLNLLAVDGPLNEQKGDSDAASWLPPNKSYRCAYVARQVAVKARYRLWVTPSEANAMRQVLSGCPGQTVPGEVARKVAAPPPSQVPPTTAAPVVTTAPAPVTTAPVDVYYPNCAAVRAAGKAPLYAGQPGYRSGLDRDHDGIACE